MLARLREINTQYATFVDMLANCDDPTLVRGAHKLQERYSPPSLDHSDSDSNAACNDYIAWLHVVLRKFFEVYAYMHTRDICDIAAVLGGMITTVMSATPSLHQCGVVAYMDEYTNCANQCAKSLDIAPYGNRKHLRRLANRIYCQFANSDEVDALDYTAFANEADAVHAYFREMPDCPDHIYTMLCVVHHLAILPMPA
jgi:hypothetical protein